MRVADAVSGLRLLAADITLLCHDCLDPFKTLLELGIITDWALADNLYRASRQGKLASSFRKTKGGGGQMANLSKSTLVESVLVLALMGIVAGAVGGLAVGVATSPKAQSSSTPGK